MPKVLPVVFTLVTKQEVGDQLREEIEVKLMTVGEQLSVTIAIQGVERFGELTYQEIILRVECNFYFYVSLVLFIIRWVSGKLYDNTVALWEP